MEAAGRKRFARKQNRRPMLELLEPRALLTTITEFPTGNSDLLPSAITTGSDGNLWFVEQNANAIASIDPKTDVIKTYTNGLPAAAIPAGITSGPNGDLWFSESSLNANAIGMFNPNNTGEAIQNFGSADGMSAKAVPTGITSDGSDIWFTEPLNDKIGKLDTTTGQITEDTSGSRSLVRLASSTRQPAVW
jgi:streptogramin lyase